MIQVASTYRLLGDDARLRLLRLASRERLNVTELTGILGIAQSGVSRHLGLLKDAGLLAEERQGGFSYYRVAEGLRGSPLWTALDAQFKAASAEPAIRADESRLQEVLRLRQENFDSHGAAADRGQLVPGRSWAAWSRALGRLLPPLVVADLGCGEGYLAIEAARWARRVIAVDRSAEVLDRARALAKRRRVSNVTWKRGDIERVPLGDRVADVALLSQALHHAARPQRAVAEASRILAPDGTLLILDLRSHDQAWVRERLGDKRLGFDEGELREWMGEASLVDIKVGVGARRSGDPFVVLVASGRKPRANGRAAGRRPRYS